MKLANFLAAHALRAPNREALKSGEASLTFAQLHTDSTRMANALIAAGNTPATGTMAPSRSTI